MAHHFSLLMLSTRYLLSVPTLQNVAQVPIYKVLYMLSSDEKF